MVCCRIYELKASGLKLFNELCLICKNTLVEWNLHNCSTYCSIAEKVSAAPPSERSVVKATEARVQQENVTGLERRLEREGPRWLGWCQQQELMGSQRVQCLRGYRRGQIEKISQVEKNIDARCFCCCEAHKSDSQVVKGHRKGSVWLQSSCGEPTVGVFMLCWSLNWPLSTLSLMSSSAYSPQTAELSHKSFSLSNSS